MQIPTNKIETTKFKADKALILADTGDELFFHPERNGKRVFCSGNRLYAATRKCLYCRDTGTKEILYTYEAGRMQTFTPLADGDSCLFLLFKRGGFLILDEDLNLIYQVEQEFEGYDFPARLTEEKLIVADENCTWFYNRADWNLIESVPFNVEGFSTDRYYCRYMMPGGNEIIHIDDKANKLFICSTADSRILSSYDIPVIRSDMRGARIALSADGSTLAYYNHDYSFENGRTIDVVESRTGALVKRCRTFGHHTQILDLEFSPDDRTILSHSYDRERTYLSLWNVETETCLWNSLQRNQFYTSFSPDGSEIYAGSENGRVSVFSTSNGELLHTPGITGSEIEKLHFDAEQNALYCETGYEENNTIIDGSSGEVLHKTYDVTFTSDDRGTVFLNRGKCLQRFCTGGREVTAQYGLSRSPEAKKILGVNSSYIIVNTERDGVNGLYLASLEGAVIHRFMEFSYHFQGLAVLTGDSRHILTAEDKTLTIRRLSDGEVLGEFSFPKPISGLAVSPEGGQAVVWDKQKQLYFFDLETAELAFIRKTTQPIKEVYYDTTGTVLVLSGEKNQILFWNPSDGTPAGAVKLPETADTIQASAIGKSGRLYTATGNGHIYTIDAGKYLPGEQEPSEPRPFMDWSRFADSVPSSGELLEAIGQTDWENFDLLSDTVPLRRLLKEIEEREGAGEVHYFCTNKILGRNKRLLHRFGHRTPVTDSCRSRDWLVTASWMDTDRFDDGGELMVWEIETGRCVNTLLNVRGGVGWPDYGCLEWHPRKPLLGAAYDTNQVGVFDPFGYVPLPLMSVDVTDGGNRPPDFSFARNGEELIVEARKKQFRFPVTDGEFHSEAVMVSTGGEDLPICPDMSQNYPEPAFEPAEYLNFHGEIPSFEQAPQIQSGGVVPPVFPLKKNGEWHWIAALENGLVYAPEEVGEEIKEELTFSILNRYAWPVEWADESQIQIVCSLEELFEHPWYGKLKEG